MNPDRSYYREFGSREAALDHCRAVNRRESLGGVTIRHPVAVVVVDGPEDGCTTVIDLPTAIDGDFAYEWSA
jgi:hypothetical protein